MRTLQLSRKLAQGYMRIVMSKTKGGVNPFPKARQTGGFVEAELRRLTLRIAHKQKILDGKRAELGNSSPTAQGKQAIKGEDNE